MVLLRVSPWRSVIRFRKWCKLGPQFIKPFRVVGIDGKVIYWLNFPEEFSQIYRTFYVFQLLKCLVDDAALFPLNEIQIDERLNYVEMLMAILDRKKKTLHNELVLLVKVQWQHRKGFKWTWEAESEITQPRILKRKSSTS